LTAKARRPVAASVALLAIAGITVGVLALLGVFAEPKPATPSSYAFDSLYEVRRGESLASERILDRELVSGSGHEGEEEDHADLGGKTEIKSEQCTVSPPPPEATRMLCRVLVAVEELHRTTKSSHVNGWEAVVTLNAHNGALTLHLSRLNGEA
jgi:hypothetical protein